MDIVRHRIWDVVANDFVKALMVLRGARQHIKEYASALALICQDRTVVTRRMRHHHHSDCEAWGRPWRRIIDIAPVPPADHNHRKIVTFVHRW